MYISKNYHQTEPGVIVRKEIVTEHFYPNNPEEYPVIEGILKSDLIHYNKLSQVCNRMFPQIIGKYHHVVSMGGGFPKFEHVIMKAKSIQVQDMSTELYQAKPIADKFREIYNAKTLAISYKNVTLDKPFKIESNVENTCITFIHFLEHCNSWENVKGWIQLQELDIVIYMPNIEAARDDNWMHYVADHNIFPTLHRLLKTGQECGYKCTGMPYDEDMLLYFTKK